MSGQELKKSVEAMQNLRNDLTSPKQKALAFLVRANNRNGNFYTPAGATAGLQRSARVALLRRACGWCPS